MWTCKGSAGPDMWTPGVQGVRCSWVMGSLLRLDRWWALAVGFRCAAVLGEIVLSCGLLFYWVGWAVGGSPLGRPACPVRWLCAMRCPCAGIARAWRAVLFWLWLRAVLVLLGCVGIMARWRCVVARFGVYD
jgi:hypothetical protein